MSSACAPPASMRTPLGSEIERFEPDDWRARTRFGALSKGLGQFGERAPFQLRDLEQAIEAERPHVLFVDEGAWGAAAAAERSGLPWAFSIVSPVPLPSRDAPPFGLGLAPRPDLVGRVRDRVAKRLTLGTLERVIAKHMNPLRAEIGLPPSRRSRTSTWPPQLSSPTRRSRSSTRAPTGRPSSSSSAPASGSRPRPCPPPGSTSCGSRSSSSPARRSSRTTAAWWRPCALPSRASPSTSWSRPRTSTSPASMFRSTSTSSARAAHAVARRGSSASSVMPASGITQKALAPGVPVVAVPCGRDPPEVARRVEVAGAGVRLPARKLSPDRLRNAVRRAIELRPSAERIASAFAAAGGAIAAGNELEALIPRSTEALHWSARVEKASDDSDEGRRGRVPRPPARGCQGRLADVCKPRQQRRLQAPARARLQGPCGLLERGRGGGRPHLPRPAFDSRRSRSGRDRNAAQTRRGDDAPVAGLGIKHRRLHRGPGAGSVSKNATAYGRGAAAPHGAGRPPRAAVDDRGSKLRSSAQTPPKMDRIPPNLRPRKELYAESKPA